MLVLHDETIRSNFYIDLFDTADSGAAIERSHKLSEDLKAKREVAATMLASGIPFEEWEQVDWQDVRSKVDKSRRRRATKKRILDRLRRSRPPEFDAAISYEVREHIIPYLPRPLPITYHELDAAMRDVAYEASDYIEEDGKFDNRGALQELSECILDEASNLRSAEFQLCTIKGSLPDIEFDDELWNGDHAAIFLNGFAREERRGIGVISTEANEIPWNVIASVRGYVTFDALQYAVDEVSRVTRALVRSALDLSFVDERPTDPRYPPSCTAEQLGDALPLVRSCLGSFYSAKPSNQKLDGRIRSCLELMVEADHQLNDAIAIPLLCTAMEALVGGGQGEITKSLAEIVATLLEPDRRARHKVISFVKKLYATRSAVVHGGKTYVAGRTRSYARIVCSHLLKAVFDWRRVQHSIIGKDDVETFFSEIRRLAPAGDSLVTANEEAVVRKLWQDAQE